MTLTVDLAICVDCLMVLANGESASEEPECEPLSLVTDGATAALGGEELGFSWQPCGGCGSRLAGDRFTATLFIDD